MLRYTVIETPCFPAKWWVCFLGGGGSNDTLNFFRDKEDAWEEANLRNERLRQEYEERKIFRAGREIVYISA